MNKEFQSLRILHGALCLGSLLFFIIVYFVLGIDDVALGQEDDLIVFNYLVPVLIVSGLLLSRMMDRTRLGAFKFPGTLPDKIIDYRSRIVLRSALIEGPILFAIVLLMLTGNKLNVLYIGIGWLGLLYVRPHMAEFIKDYKLTAQEQQEMQ